MIHAHQSTFLLFIFDSCAYTNVIASKHYPKKDLCAWTDIWLSIMQHLEDGVLVVHKLLTRSKKHTLDSVVSVKSNRSSLWNLKLGVALRGCEKTQRHMTGHRFPEGLCIDYSIIPILWFPVISVSSKCCLTYWLGIDP